MTTAERATAAPPSPASASIGSPSTEPASTEPPSTEPPSTAPAAALNRRASARLGLRVASPLLAIAIVVIALVSAGLGQLSIPVSEIVGSVTIRLNEALAWAGLGALQLPVLAAPSSPTVDATLWLIRFPRIVLAAVVGAALALGGVLMQGVFRNPLAEPGVVGVSAGAAVAASAVIVFEVTIFGPLTSTAFAFVGGLATTMLVYAASRSRGRTEVVTLVLTGIAVNAVAGAAIALFIFLSTTQQREQIVFWQLGSLNGSRWIDVAIGTPVLIVGAIASMLLARRLDLLSLGERQARHLGVPIEQTRILAIVVVSVLTAAAVALCGIIAFVGLVVPHLMRMLLGPAHRALIPASALGGGVLLLLADLVARTAVPYADLPIGMLTALVGGPFFFWQLRRMRSRSGGFA